MKVSKFNLIRKRLEGKKMVLEILKLHVFWDIVSI